MFIPLSFMSPIYRTGPIESSTYRLVSGFGKRALKSVIWGSTERVLTKDSNITVTLIRG